MFMLVVMIVYINGKSWYNLQQNVSFSIHTISFYYYMAHVKLRLS